MHPSLFTQSVPVNLAWEGLSIALMHFFNLQCTLMHPT